MNLPNKKVTQSLQEKFRRKNKKLIRMSKKLHNIFYLTELMTHSSESREN